MNELTGVDQLQRMQELGQTKAEVDLDVLPFPQLPFLLKVSGLYKYERSLPVTPLPHVPTPIPNPQFPPGPQPGPISVGEEIGALAVLREEIRLDVDDRYPQMTVSGTRFSLLAQGRVHWIAHLTKTAANAWAGDIWYKDGSPTALPYTHVRVTAHPSIFPLQRSATIVFSGGSGATATRVYAWASSFFHTVEFEFDTVVGSSAVTSIDTCAHPNRPASLPCEPLSIQTVYGRAGFDVQNTGGNGSVPLALAGTNALWSDAEMHDAMQAYWSRFANKAQWSLWTLFAARHEIGSSLGGIMFDDVGPNQRQGTSIFLDSFISQQPAGDPNPVAFVERMRFWTACHEIGHCFNLAHSWQKALNPQLGGNPWIPLVDEPEARSFMNYPYNVLGGSTAFFANFAYRFSDAELLFMRHAPERFVEMGNADWFTNHGFRELRRSAPDSGLTLEIRVNRERPVFEFLEPVMAELKLTNSSGSPMIVNAEVLRDDHHLAVMIRRPDGTARRWLPFAQYCWKPQPAVLQPGESLYESVFIAAGRNGWDLAAPGNYTVEVALEARGMPVVSNALGLKILPPRGWDEEALAQDFFSDDVGRTLAFDGTRQMSSANAVLREVAEKLPERRVANHALVALASPLRRDYKLLRVPSGHGAMTSVAGAGGKIDVAAAAPQQARAELGAALLRTPDVAAETLGHIDYKGYVDGLTDLLETQDEHAEAKNCQEELLKTMTARGVKSSVLAAIEARGKASGV